MNVQVNDFVLEIGSGHNPSARSNVLCDKFLVDDTQRGGQIVADRPIVEADGQYLPFADNSFDYVICRHVLEHVEDPELMISELERVASRGYIETPSELGERLYGWPYHDWILNQVNDKLIIQKNQLDNQFGHLFHILASRDSDFSRFHQSYHSLFLIQYEWNEKVKYELVNSDESVLKKELGNIETLLANKLSNRSLSRWYGKILRKAMTDILPTQLTRQLKSWFAQRHQSNKNPDLTEIVVCPLCKVDVEWERDVIICNSCKVDYPIVNHIPRLVPSMN